MSVIDRFFAGPPTPTVSQLLWLRNPGNLGSDGEGWEGWEQTVLLEGVGNTGAPDVVIQLVLMEAGGQEYEVLVTGEDFNPAVSDYITMSVLFLHTM